MLSAELGLEPLIDYVGEFMRSRASMVGKVAKFVAREVTNAPLEVFEVETVVPPRFWRYAFYIDEYARINR